MDQMLTMGPKWYLTEMLYELSLLHNDSKFEHAHVLGKSHKDYNYRKYRIAVNYSIKYSVSSKPNNRPIMTLSASTPDPKMLPLNSLVDVKFDKLIDVDITAVEMRSQDRIPTHEDAREYFSKYVDGYNGIIEWRNMYVDLVSTFGTISEIELELRYGFEGLPVLCLKLYQSNGNISSFFRPIYF